MHFNVNTWGSLRNVVLPAVWAQSRRAEREGIPVHRADLHADYLSDALMLTVEYRLLSRRDMDNGTWRDDVVARLQSAMQLLHRTPQAKALCVDRRRLAGRGEMARKAKAVRKPK
jgi:hypothetical protein